MPATIVQSNKTPFEKKIIRSVLPSARQVAR